MHSARDEEAIEGIVPKNSAIVAESLLGPIHPAFTTDDVFIAVSWWGHLLFRSAIGGDLSLSLAPIYGCVEKMTNDAALETKMNNI